MKNYRNLLDQTVRDQTGVCESNGLFRDLAANLPLALLIRDIDSTTVCYVNPRWETLTGRPAVAGDSLTKLNQSIHPDDRHRVLDHTISSSTGNTACDYRIVRPDGAIRWVHARTFSCEPGGRRRVGVLLDDITEQKKESARIDGLKDEFVSTVSHELRTPLTSIVGSLGLLIGNVGDSLSEPVARLLKIAHTNSQRLVRLVNAILDMEKIESGKVVFALKRVELRSLIKQTIEVNQSFAHTSGVRIRLDAQSTACSTIADPDWLIQVVTNLLSNAIKFSPRDQEVVVAIKKHKGLIRISVRDHGCGISEAFKPRVFEKFAQADACDAREKGGTGLGLSIVKGIVERLGGAVEFKDAPGGGTVFHVDLGDGKGSPKSSSEGKRVRRPRASGRRVERK